MRIEVDTKWCKGCGLCVHFCPGNVLAMGSVRNERGYLTPYAENIGGCVGCETCERICPDFCVELIRD